MNESLDREFWMTVRAALIMFVRAIEKRYNLKTHEFTNVVFLEDSKQVANDV